MQDPHAPHIFSAFAGQCVGESSREDEEEETGVDGDDDEDVVVVVAVAVAVDDDDDDDSAVALALAVATPIGASALLECLRLFWRAALGVTAAAAN